MTLPTNLNTTLLAQILVSPLPVIDLDAIGIVEIETQLLTLRTEEAFVLRCRFNTPKMTLYQTGQLMKISPGRVRQRESNALRKLRHPVRIRPIMRAIQLPNESY